jgi:hypothetical protein
MSSNTVSPNAQRNKKSVRKSWNVSDNKGTSILLIGLMSLGVLQSFKRLEGNSLVYITSGQSALGRYLAITPKAHEVTPNGIWDADYTLIDAAAKSIEYHGDSVQDLAKILSEYATTPIQKARIAYTWIAHNINYNTQEYMTKNYTHLSANETLQSRRAVCSGYSNLYQALTSAMGLRSVVIEGYAKGLGYGLGDLNDVNHAWNAVQVNNYWYFVDATLGSGTIQDSHFVREFDPFFFGPPPHQYFYSHFPVREEWQLLVSPKTKAQFENTPQLSSRFFKNGLRLVSDFKHTIRVTGSQNLVLEAPANTELVARYQLVGSSAVMQPLEQLARIQRYGKQVFVQLDPWSSVYDLFIYAKNNQKPGTYEQVAGYKVVVN